MSKEIENFGWLLIYTKARQEKRAKKNLENQGYEIFLPMIVYESESQNKPATMETMFPRYLFVKINTEKDNWINIKSTRGVSHLVTFGQRTGKVPNEVIAFLQKSHHEKDTYIKLITYFAI